MASLKISLYAVFLLYGCFVVIFFGGGGGVQYKIFRLGDSLIKKAKNII